MKRNLKYTLTAMAGGLLLAGCCSARHAGKWEYKAAWPPPHDLRRAEVETSFLNEQAKDGWIFLEKDSNGLFFFKRLER
jgi:hypothetical protein